MNRVEELQRYYQYCRTRMNECAGHSDAEGFEKWLKLSDKINKEIDKALKIFSENDAK